MGLKETFQEMDKMKASVVALLGLTFVATSFNAYQTMEVKNILSGGDTPQAKPAASADKPTKKPSDYKFGTSYEKAVKDKKPMALLFYADWCGYCIRFMPIYEKLFKQYKNKYNFVKINVEDDKYSEQVEKYEIQAFPTLFLVNPKEDEHIHVENRHFGDNKKMKEIFDDFYAENK